MNSDVDLLRFKLAQESGGVEHGSTYAQAIAELRAGKKLSHWIWYVFPQAFHDDSLNGQTYKIRNLAEAEAYVADDLLWGRYVESVTALEQSMWRVGIVDGRLPQLEEVVGTQLNARHIRSSLTLFFNVTKNDPGDRTNAFINLVDYRGDRADRDNTWIGLPIVWGNFMSCAFTHSLWQRWESEKG